MKQFLAPSTLLLVVLLFPGLSRVTHANHQDPEGPRKQEESPGRGTNRSHPLHHQVKRYLVPREPPFPDE
uniref:Sperm associated antigen 11 B n=1 Tax=Bubalus bubalis TaxID=89462 RepID=A0A1Y0EVB7_BUBBU|nr:sperm associated antigen 11 B [Bubalus bubalis]